MCTAGVESRTPANRHASLAISVPVIAFLFSRTNMLAHEAVRVISCPWSPLGVVALLRQWQWARAPAESTPSERYLRSSSVVLACWFLGVYFFFSFYAGLYPMKSPSFTLIAVGNMWSLIKNIFSVEIAFISWANFSWPSTHQSFFGKGNSSLWVSKCQATEQKEREGERGKNNS